MPLRAAPPRRVGLSLTALVALLAVVAGCAGPFADAPAPGTPRGPSLPTFPQADDGAFVLYVSNQSFAVDPVDIAVSIDGRLAVSATFGVEGQHTWVEHRFRLAAGRHRVRAVSQRGGAVLERTFAVGERAWAVLEYRYDPGTGDARDARRFDWRLAEQPVAFS